MQGKSHVQVNKPYDNSNWLLVGLHPATRGVKCTMYTVSVLLGSLDVMEEIKKVRKAVFYVIAHKNMLFLIFRNDLDRTEVQLLLTG